MLHHLNCFTMPSISQLSNHGNKKQTFPPNKRPLSTLCLSHLHIARSLVQPTYFAHSYVPKYDGPNCNLELARAARSCKNAAASYSNSQLLSPSWTIVFRQSTGQRQDFEFNSPSVAALTLLIQLYYFFLHAE